MSHHLIVFFGVLSLFIGGGVSAQETKGWLGVEVRDVTKAEADQLHWDAPRGAIVAKAPDRGSPAEKAGLKAGDIIVAVERMLIDTAAEFNAAIETKQPGSELRLQVLSGGSERRISATISEQPAMQVAADTAVPQLMLDTGGHMANIKGLVFTPDGKQLVSAGEDKVIRVWDLQANKTVRFLRGQVGAGSEGKVLATALSPDGSLLAAGGWMKVPNESDHAIRLYEFTTGRLAALLKVHTGAVLGLAFSPDGKQLVSGSSDSTAAIWDIESRKLSYLLKGHTDAIVGVGFTPDGARAVTGSQDTTLKLWSARDGKEIATLTGHKGKVLSLSLSPRDRIIASGASDGEIRLWDAGTGQFLRVLATQRNAVGALAFSSNGEVLVSTGGVGGPRPWEQHVWNVASGSELVHSSLHDNTSYAAAGAPYGDLVATGGFGGDIQVWNSRSGHIEASLRGTGLQNWAACFGPDSRSIYWGQTFDSVSQNVRGPLQFLLRLPGPGQTLGQPERVAPGTPRLKDCALEKVGDLSLAADSDFATLVVRRSGVDVAQILRGPATGLRHRSYTLTADGQAIVSGGNGGYLMRYRLDGKPAQRYIGHESEVWALSPSPDGRLLLSVSADQTVRIWNLRSGELIATIFYGRDGEWVMWTPQGYYTGSPGSDKIVGWQINKGAENAADYVGADQLRQHLNRPDIVEKAIILASAEQAVRESPGTSFKLADLLAKPVPRFRIVSPASGSTERNGRALIKIDVGLVPNPIKSMRVQVNGRQVSEITPDIGSGGFKTGLHELDVPLAKGRNEVRITLSNDIGDRAETVTLSHEGDGDLDKRGTLYILAVGVDQYPRLGKTCGPTGNASCDLKYSGADARKWVEAAERRLGPAHSKVVKRVLVNGVSAGDAPTATNIIDAIDLLKQAIETDTVLLFIAGHGTNEGASYRFLATNAERSGDAFRGATVVPWQIFQDAVERAKGRRILFLDTCHSGNAYNQTLGNAAYHANIIAYTSARFDQEALEDASLGHGIFTYALIEGLDGKGSLGTKREISTRDLSNFVAKRVDELAKAMKSEQEPQYFKGRDAEDYVLAKW
jgi:WD40 repeat protein